jgi:hypothetical protein
VAGEESAGSAADQCEAKQVRLGDAAAARSLVHEALVEALRSGPSATLIFCVMAEADRRFDEGDHARALALLALARAHPGFTNDNEDEIGRMLGRIGLTVDDVDLAHDQVDNATLVAAAEALVAELAGEP